MHCLSHVGILRCVLGVLLLYVRALQENIITMVQDDLAENFMNPHPGKIYNQPGGPDVYEDVKLVRKYISSSSLPLAVPY